MSHPQTMFQLTGRGHAPASLNNATLLIIDAQEEYRSGVLALPGLAPALAEIASLLAAARSAGADIVHTSNTSAFPAACSTPAARAVVIYRRQRHWQAKSWWKNACPTPSLVPSCMTACRRSAILT